MASGAGAPSGSGVREGACGDGCVIGAGIAGGMKPGGGGVMPGCCVPSGVALEGGEAIGIGAGSPPRNPGTGRGEWGRDGSKTLGGSAIRCDGMPFGR